MVRTQHEASYSDLVLVRTQHEAQYGVLSGIQIQHEALYSIRARAIKQHEAPYSDKFYVTKQHECNWAINTFNRLLKDHTAYWVMSDNAVINVAIPSSVAIIGGMSVPLLEVSIAMSEGDSLWSCSMILGDFTHYYKFVEGAQYTIDMLGDIYTFQYHTKSVTRGEPGDARLVVEGLSPAMVLQSPRSETVTKEYTTPMLAKDLIEDLLGMPVTWEFPIWVIQANVVVATGAIPLDLANTIIRTAGGVLESNIDGSLLVRKKYIVNTTKYSTVLADHVYADTSDNLSSSENYEVRSGYNRYRVTNIDTLYGDTLEFVAEDDSDTKGVIRAYPTPWRLNIKIDTTDPGTVYLGLGTWDIRTEEDVVEFVEGKGSLSYIAESISSVVWHSDSLGGILHTQYSRELTADVLVNHGYGLATVTYKVKCLVCDTVGVLDSHVQYVIVDS